MRALLGASWRIRPDPVKADWVLAALLTLAGALQVSVGHVANGDRLSGAVAVVVLGVAVACRRSYPTAAGVVAGILMPLEIALRGDPQIISNAIAYLCALYALSVWAPPRGFALGAAATVGADLVSTTRYGNGALWALATLVAILLLRRVVRERDQRAELAARERDLAARAAVAEERARIARELHDVVAHSVSVMVVQAQAGPRLLADPEQLRGVFGSIEASGREALVELRRLLGILRTADEQLAIEPQPGLGSLDSLLEQMRQAGLSVELRTEGEPLPLPAGVDLSAYRIVQEALTNVLKHATGGGAAHIAVRYTPSSLQLEIVDDGSTPSASVGGSGHGLVGMRERVALYGGVLETGAANGRGYAVRAQFPIRRAAG